MVFQNLSAESEAGADTFRVAGKKNKKAGALGETGGIFQTQSVTRGKPQALLKDQATMLNYGQQNFPQNGSHSLSSCAHIHKTYMTSTLRKKDYIT